MNTAYSTECVLGAIHDALVEEVVAFWHAEGAFADPAEAARRAQDLVVVARDADQRMVGVITRFSANVPWLLNQPLYVLRGFVADAHRGAGLVIQLATAALTVLNQRFVSGEDRSHIGTYVEMQSVLPRAVRDLPRWVLGGRESVFVGTNDQGYQRMVHYFDGARLRDTQQASEPVDTAPATLPALPEGYRLKPVWQQLSPALRQTVIDYWKAHTQLDEATMQDRVNRVVCLAYGPANELAAVCTADPVRIAALRNNLLYRYRSFVADAAVREVLSAQLLVAARNLLEQAYNPAGGPQPIGLFVDVQDPQVMQQRNQAVWPLSGLAFIGVTPAGHHCRVYYFDQAKLA